MAKLYVFDLDGTLADTALDLALALQYVFTEIQLPPPTDSEVLARIGHGAKNLVQTSLSAALGHDPEATLVERALSLFLNRYNDFPVVHTRAYAGVSTALERLSSTTKAVLTNKPEKPALAILNHLNLKPFFPVVIGGDSGFGLKPSPQGLTALMQMHEAGPEDTVLIGDGLQDQEVAENAGIRFIAYLSGFGATETLLARQHRAAFTDFSLLPTLLESI